MVCPKCNEIVKLRDVVNEWEEMVQEDGFEDEVPLTEMGIFINWICPHCDESIAGIFIEQTTGSEEIEAPAFGKDEKGDVTKVKLPKFD